MKRLAGPVNNKAAPTTTSLAVASMTLLLPAIKYKMKVEIEISLLYSC